MRSCRRPLRKTRKSKRIFAKIAKIAKRISREMVTDLDL
jgi:hypothetical protein